MNAYRVEPDTNVCAYCGHGGTYTVIGPGNVAIGTSFADETDASEMASMLNAAYEHGARQIAVSINDFLELYDAAHEVIDKIRMHDDHAEYEGGMNAVNNFRDISARLRFAHSDKIPDPLTGSTNEDDEL